jgi:hypothetical protein
MLLSFFFSNSLVGAEPVFVEAPLAAAWRAGSAPPAAARSHAPDALSEPEDPNGTYLITTSRTDPSCLTPYGGYINLETYNIQTHPQVQGDNMAFHFFTEGYAFRFYGKNSIGIGVSDDGMIVFDPINNYDGSPGVPQTVPDINKPSNLLGLLWQDLVVVYDGARNHGVTAATYGADIAIVEYDDVRLKSNPDYRYDFEVILRRRVSNAPGDHEIVVAYDNLNGPLDGPVTVGVENDVATAGVALVNNVGAGGVVESGLMVCFNWTGGDPDPTPTPGDSSPTPTPSPSPPPRHRLAKALFLPAVLSERPALQAGG